MNGEKKECGHRYGVYHRASDAKVRIARSKKKYTDSIMYALEISIPPFRSHEWVYI